MKKRFSTKKANFRLIHFVLSLFLLVTVGQRVYAQQISGSWASAATSGFTPRYGLASAAVDGLIYVTGGVNPGAILGTLEVFDPSADTWSTPETIGNFTPRAYHTASVVNGKIYLIGGLTVVGNATSVVSTVDIFDPLAETWSLLTTSGTFTPRWGQCSAVVGNQIYVFGGDSLSQSFYPGELATSVQVLDLSTNSWSTLATTGSFIIPFLSSCNVIGGKIYFTGGTDSTAETSLSILEIYNPATSTWSIPQTQGAMTARSGHAAAYIDSNLIVFSGHGQSALLSSTEAFNLATNTWYTPVTTGNFTARMVFCASVVNNKVYAIGGENLTHVPQNVNEVFTLTNSAVSEPSADSGIEIFPNPVANFMTVRGLALSSRNLVILDAIGRKVLDLKDNNGVSPNFDIDTHALPDGSYFLELQTSEGRQLVPFTVLH